MNRKAYIGVLTFALVCFSFGMLTGCSSSNNNSGGGGGTTNPITVTISTAPPSSMTVNTTASVAATVANDSANAGVSWSCAPSGSCGSFSPSTSASGSAVTYTAPAAATSVTITATSVTNSSVSANASVTVTAVAANTYVFYASGEEEINGGPNYYAVAGAATVDASGNVDGGELDYNDAFGITSGGGTNTPDSITGGTLTVDPTTGVGTLTLVTSNTSLGGVNTTAGTIEFAIQFVNDNHALISQWDGSATSSGSFDLQNTSLGTQGQSSFVLSGVDPSYNSVGMGGIFTPSSSTAASVVLDVNDDGTVTTNTSYPTVVIGTPDSFGRTLITGVGAITFAAYPVTQEAIRLIDIDTTDAAVGSAYGQGAAAGTFSNASFGTTTPYVFTLLGQFEAQYGTLAQFSTDGNGNVTGGVGDDNEIDNNVFEQGDTLTGTYLMSGTGYGSLSPVWGSGLEDVTALGVYMVDPALDINDPNNTTSVDVGGAVVLDLSTIGVTPGGIGVITPATDTTQADFAGNYAAGFQELNVFGNSFICGLCEFDMVGPFSMTATTGPLATASIGAEDSDPFGSWPFSGTPGESSGDTFTSTPVVTSTAGYYNGSPLAATINTASGDMDMDLFQASATTAYWIEMDDSEGVFIGPIEAQGDLSTVPALKRPGKAQTKQTKPVSRRGGPTR